MQDWLVKEMRLRGIATMTEAQAYVLTFIAAWNQKFAVEPRDPSSAHRPWTGTAEELDLALASREERVLSRRLTFRWEDGLYCVKIKGPGTSMRGGKIEVLNYLDGRVRVLYKDRVLDCTRFKSLPRPPRAEDEKTIDARMDLLAAAAAGAVDTAHGKRGRGQRGRGHSYCGECGDISIVH